MAIKPLTEEIRIRGVNHYVPAVEVQGRTVIVTGKWLKTAQIKDEELVEGELVKEPGTFIATLKTDAPQADLLAFSQKPPNTDRKHGFHFEWDNWAVLPTKSYNEWWEGRLPQESRKNVRRAGKRGVVVKVVPFDDQLVAGIQRIYNETPVRQGRRFWHYGKDLEAVRRENATYIDRSDFVGAFLGDELIGFIKVIYVERIAMLIQILAMNEHHDKRPMNALLASTVELCERKEMSHLVYGNYSYGRKTESSLAEFKRRNGFEELRFPRYYVPLTLKGKLALSSGLHLGPANLVPSKAMNLLLACRARYQQWRATSRTASVNSQAEKADA